MIAVLLLFTCLLGLALGFMAWASPIIGWIFGDGIAGPMVLFAIGGLISCAYLARR